jgi:hypothetical protein
MYFLLKAKIATGTIFFMLGGCDESRGVEFWGFARFRRAIGGALTLLTERLPHEASRLSRSIQRINQSPVSFYGFRADPGLIYLRQRKDFGTMDWAGTLVHAAVHSEQYRGLRRLHAHEDAVMALMKNPEFCEEARKVEVSVLREVGILDPPAHIRRRGDDNHMYFGGWRRAGRNARSTSISLS